MVWRLIFGSSIFLSIVVHGVNSSHITSSKEHNETVYRSWSKNLQIVRVNAMTFIKYDNKGEHVMGVPDDKCDNARVRKIISITNENFN